MLESGNKDGVLEVLLPFVETKHNDYWVWELLGDAVENSNLRLSCYCRALSCRVKDSFLRKLYLKTCDVLLQQGKYDEAKAMLKKALSISAANGWKVACKYQNYTEQQWYIEARDITLGYNFLIEHGKDTEYLLYKDKPIQNIVITHVNTSKRTFSFVFEDHRDGYAKLSRTMPQPVVGNIYSCQMDQKKGLWQIYSAIEVEDIAKYEGNLVRHEKGTLKKSAKGFGFVKNIFIPENLVATINNGQMISVVAIPSYDKGKDSWGWKTIKIQ